MRLFYFCLLFFLLPTAIFAQLAKDTATAKDLCTTALTERRHGDFESATQKYNQAIALYQQHGFDSLAINVERSIADIYFAQGLYEKAIQKARTFIDRSNQLLGDPNAIAVDGYAIMSRVAGERGNVSHSIKLINKALKTRLSLSSKVDAQLVSLYNDLGVSYYYHGELERAINAFEKALTLEKELNKEETVQRLNFMMNIAGMQESLGNYQAAQDKFTALISMGKRLGIEESGHMISLYSNLGMIYFRQKEYKRALHYYEIAIAQIKKIHNDNHPHLISAYNKLGALYRQTNQMDAAFEVYHKAIAVAKEAKVEKSNSLAYVYSNLANLYQFEGQFDKAEPIFNQYLQFCKQQFGPQSIKAAGAYVKLAALYQGWKKYKQVMPMLEKARAIFRKKGIDRHLILIEAYYNEAATLFATKQNEEALRTINEALAVNSNIEPIGSLDAVMAQQLLEELLSFKFLAKFLNIHATIYYQKYKESAELDDLKTAYQTHLLLIDLFDNVVEGFGEVDDKLQLLEQAHSTYSNAIGVAKLLHQKTNHPKYLKEAFEHSERNKSILLLSSLANTSALQIGGIPDSLRIQGNVLKRKIDAANQAIQEAIQAGDSLKTAKHRKTYIDLKESADKHQAYLKQKFASYRRQKNNAKITSIDTIQASLAAKECLIEYFITPKKDSLHIFALSTDQFKTYLIELPADFEADLLAFRRLMSDYKIIRQSKSTNDYQQLAYQFYQLLLEKIQADFSQKQLIVITDGLLGQLPFEALVTAVDNEKQSWATLNYLLNKNTISYAYSATLWLENQGNHPKSNAQVLAFAANYEQQSLAHRSPRIRKMREQLDEIPAVRQEVQLLEKQFEGVFLYDSLASEAAYKQQASQFGVIHLAMHGLLDKGFPMGSSLAFSENKDSTEDNFLFAYELSNIPLDADLVVLSACETGLGKFEQGEGVMSLARSFMYAGVPAMVVSLWQVNDQATAMLMQYYYHNLSLGMQKSTALQQAKLEYLENITDQDPLLGHPVFWAPFIQIGNNDEVAIQRKGSFRQWMIVGWGVLILATFGGYYWWRNRRRLS